MNKFWTICFAVFSLSACKQESYEPPKSGIYSNNLELAFETNTKLISGYYQNENCSFYIAGKFAGKKTNIITWFLGDPSSEQFGILENLGANTWKISLLKDYPNCPNTFEVGQEVKLLDAKPTWLRIASIRNPEIELYSQADSSTSTHEMLEMSNLVKVIEVQNKWLKIDGDSTHYWITRRSTRKFPG